MFSYACWFIEAAYLKACSIQSYQQNLYFTYTYKQHQDWGEPGELSLPHRPVPWEWDRERTIDRETDEAQVVCCHCHFLLQWLHFSGRSRGRGDTPTVPQPALCTGHTHTEAPDTLLTDAGMWVHHGVYFFKKCVMDHIMQKGHPHYWQDYIFWDIIILPCLH